jgi:ribosomal protein S1
MIGQTVYGTVTEHKPFGVFLKIEGIGLAIAERILMGKEGIKTPEGYPEIGTIVPCRVIGFRDYCHVIEISLSTECKFQ